MKPENRKRLDEMRHHHFTLVNAQYMKGLNGQEREDMVRIMSEEFVPGYTADLWCPACVSDMVLSLYNHYDNFLASEVVAPPPLQPVIVEVEPELIVAASFPKNDAPTPAPITVSHPARRTYNRRK